MNNILKTDKNDLIPLLARLILGVVIFPHGAQKMLGWFGGYGFTATADYFTDVVGLPYLIAVLVIFIEFFGSLALLLGIGSRIAAALISVVMLGAVVTAHLSVGFFMDWNGASAGEGFEYHILAVGLALISIIKGSGMFSLDAKIASL